MTAGSWRHAAACAGQDPDLWFPGSGQVTVAAAALAVCQECPVRAACLEFALTQNMKDGIWGGTVPRTRRGLRRAQGLTLGNVRGPVEPCGTAAAYRRHQRHGERPCDACTAASHRAEVTRWERFTARQARAGQPAEAR